MNQPELAVRQPHPAEHPRQNRSQIAAGASRPSLDQARGDNENDTQHPPAASHAITADRDAAAIFRETGNRFREGRALNPA